MKFVLTVLVITLFSTAFMAQDDDIIGVPIIIKKGETKKSGRLQIKYLGNLTNNRQSFEITDKGKSRKFKAVNSFKINGLVIEVIERIANENAIKIVVMTEEMFRRKSIQKLNELFSNPILDISIIEKLKL